MKYRSKSSLFSNWMCETFPVNSKSRAGKRLVCNVGVNNAKYLTMPMINGKQVTCPVYGAWKHVLVRVYDEKYHDTRPTYKDTKVCDEWLTFSNFREWFIENHIDNYDLDKDLLVVGNRIYSPETCVFVPKWLNNFIMDCGSSRGEYKIGVHWDKDGGKFRALCQNPISKKRDNLGRFTNENDAHNAWLKRKLELAFELKVEMDEIDLRIYPNIVEIINNTK